VSVVLCGAHCTRLAQLAFAKAQIAHVEQIFRSQAPPHLKRALCTRGRRVSELWLSGGAR